MKAIIQELEKGIDTKSPEEMEAIGVALANDLAHDTILALHGNLGVGKTTFTKGLAKGLGIEKTITSPTFNLYTMYEGNIQLVHLDAYRLTPETSLENLMLDDFLISPYCLVIEWPENIDPSLVEKAMHLKLSILSENGLHRVQKFNAH